jgi:hypothetical protein
VVKLKGAEFLDLCLWKMTEQLLPNTQGENFRFIFRPVPEHEMLRGAAKYKSEILAGYVIFGILRSKYFRIRSLNHVGLAQHALG